MNTCKESFFKGTFVKGVRICLLGITALVLVQCSSSKNTADAPERKTGVSEGQGVFQDSWLETVKGNMPLVISAPHGGTIAPMEIKDRDCGTKVMDNNTAELALEIENALEIHGKKPYLVIARLARSKIDFNRDLETATCGNPQMEYTWRQYHEYIEEAIEEAVKKFGYAMYIDLHGQSHPIKRLELGYLLRGPALKQVHESGATDSIVSAKTSVQNLLKENGRLTLKQLLMGEKALGTLMDQYGFPAVPSLNDPYPKEGEPYFTGGYNTRRYTASDHPNVFGMQIEANFKGVRDSEENRKKFSEAFAKAVTVYLDFITSNWEH